jgi:carbonic anhydrase
VGDIYQKNRVVLAAIPDDTEKTRRLCELNVIAQVVSVGNTTIIRDAWGRGQRTAVHGWIYDIADGFLKNLNVSIASNEELEILLERT